MKPTYFPGLLLGIVLLSATAVRADDGSAPTVGDNLRSAGTNISAAAVKIGTEIKAGAVTAAMEVKTGAVWVAGQVKTGAVKVATDVQDSTGIPLIKDRRTAPELLADAKKATDAHKYREALDTLDRLRHFKLTDEQQKEADQLKAQIHKAFVEGTPATTKPTEGGK